MSLGPFRAMTLLRLALQALDGGRLAADADVGTDGIVARAARAGAALVRPPLARTLDIAIVLHVRLAILRGRRGFMRRYRGDNHQDRRDKGEFYENLPRSTIVLKSIGHGAYIPAHSDALLPRHRGALRSFVCRGKTQVEAPGAQRRQTYVRGCPQGAADPTYPWRQGRMHYPLASLL
jgi:hypothetical protein